MKRHLIIFIVVCALSLSAMAQTKPFAAFDKAVSDRGFNGNKSDLSEIFTREKIRLGDNFESELWKYLGTDTEKHYWLSCFVECESYLHGSKPLPELAFRIRERGVRLLDKAKDEESLGRKITMLRDMAIYLYLSGKRDQAIAYKKLTAPLFARYPDIGGYIGATSKYDYCIFDNLEKDPTVCQKDVPKRSEKIVSAGILNGKALELPLPDYPKELRQKGVTGQVSVKVTLDFDGRVISAEGFEGAPELFEAAVEAAKKARFEPTLLSGNPVKVSGIIIYNFVK